MTSPSTETAPQDPEDVFLPVIGQFAWLVKRGHGSFLTMEFGSPHLIVREPITVSPNSLPQVSKRLAMRRVYVTGDFHFWMIEADWRLCVADDTVTSDDVDRARVDRCLDELDGQRLLSVTRADAPHACVLQFDQGGIPESKAGVLRQGRRRRMGLSHLGRRHNFVPSRRTFNSVHAIARVRQLTDWRRSRRNREPGNPVVSHQHPQRLTDTASDANMIPID
jgi:hypothetical protein